MTIDCDVWFSKEQFQTPEFRNSHVWAPAVMVWLGFSTLVVLYQPGQINTCLWTAKLSRYV